MRRLRVPVLILASCLGVVAVIPRALALPVQDHLKCYKVRDSLRQAVYTADLAGDLGVDVGCVIKVPAVYACVPTSKTNVKPTPPPPFGNGVTAGARSEIVACYRVKCPRAGVPSALGVQDQFGERPVKPITTSLLCTPFVIPVTTTTTSTLPPQVCSQPGACNPACGAAQGCANVRNGCACADAPACGAQGDQCGGNCPVGTTEPCHLDTSNGQCMCGFITGTQP
jgi:hypothetical protein